MGLFRKFRFQSCGPGAGPKIRPYRSFIEAKLGLPYIMPAKRIEYVGIASAAGLLAMRDYVGWA